MSNAVVAIPNLKLDAVNGPQACNVYFDARNEAPQRMFAKIANMNPELKFKPNRLRNVVSPKKDEGSFLIDV